jgi:hypothetical protein
MTKYEAVLQLWSELTGANSRNDVKLQYSVLLGSDINLYLHAFKPRKSDNCGIWVCVQLSHSNYYTIWQKWLKIGWNGSGYLISEWGDSMFEDLQFAEEGPLNVITIRLVLYNAINSILNEKGIDRIGFMNLKEGFIYI